MPAALDGTYEIHTLIAQYTNSAADLGAIFPLADFVTSKRFPIDLALVGVTLTSELITAFPNPNFDPSGVGLIVGHEEKRITIDTDGTAPVISQLHTRGGGLFLSATSRLRLARGRFVPVRANDPVSLYCWAFNGASPLLQVSAVAVCEFVRP